MKVNMFELSQFEKGFKQTMERKEIEYVDEFPWGSGEGVSKGIVKINKATTSIDEAEIEKADLIINAVPSFGHETFAELAAPRLQDGQIFCYIGEGNGSSMLLTSIMRKHGIKKDVIIGETNTLPYACMKTAPSKVFAFRKKGGTLAAAFPAENTEKLVAALKEIWPFVTSATNVLETILLNFNAIDHVAPYIPIVGWMDSPYAKEPISLRQATATPTVIRVLDAVDQETIAVRKALGFKEMRGWCHWQTAQQKGDSVAPEYATTWDAWTRNLDQVTPNFTPKPGSFEGMDRQVTESVPYGLTLMASIGDYIGVDTLAIDAVITFTSVMTQRDYWDGRTLETLGMPMGLSIEELNRYLYNGSLPTN
jgi:opine dehydrogenase